MIESIILLYCFCTIIISTRPLRMHWLVVRQKRRIAGQTKLNKGSAGSDLHLEPYNTDKGTVEPKWSTVENPIQLHWAIPIGHHECLIKSDTYNSDKRSTQPYSSVSFECNGVKWVSKSILWISRSVYPIPPSETQWTASRNAEFIVFHEPPPTTAATTRLA